MMIRCLTNLGFYIFDFMGLKCFNFPKNNIRLLYIIIIPSLIMKSMISRNENNDIIIDSNKDVLINLVYVNDISKIIERCIHNTDIQGNLLVFNKNGIYNLEKIINIINNYIENKNKIIFNNENLKKTNIMKPKLNKFEKYFCDFEFTEIEKSLKTTIDNINQ